MTEVNFLVKKGLTVPKGSASTPSVIFDASDPNTGLYSPGADQVAVATNGTGRLFVDANGNVGLGTATTNWSLLDGLIVQTGNGYAGINIASSSATDNAYLAFGYGTTAAEQFSASIGRVGNNTLVLGTNNAERLRITSAGLVGIGTSSPSKTLDVNGSFRQLGGEFIIEPTASNTVVSITPQTSTNGAILRFTNGSTTSYFGKENSTGGYTWSSGGTAYATVISAYGSTAPIQFGHNSPSVTLDSSGRVGIGTTSPGVPLEVNGNASASNFSVPDTNFIGFGSYTAYLSGSSASNFINFSTGSTERARIDSSGRLLVGTSSTSKDFSAVFQGNSADATGGANLLLARGTSSPADGSAIGYLSFTDSNHNTAALIQAQRDGGTWDSGASQPGRLVFSTTANGAGSPTERMRINAVGALKASLDGTYESATSSYHELRTQGSGDWIAYFTQTSASSPNGVVIKYSAAAPNTSGSTFLYCEDTVGLKASIRSNGGIANFTANDANLSDRNVKKDIGPAGDTWDCVRQWEIVNYRYKDQPDVSDLNIGVIAQQVAESCPEVITVFEEAKDDQPERLGVKEQQMYWMAIKALQEAQVRIEQLEQRLTDAGIA
jgi:hypothetical protein